MRAFYDRSSEQFALEHPGQEVKLAAVKLFTLLRPDTKVHRLGSLAGAGKALEALFVPLWFAIVIWFRLRRTLAWGAEDSLMVVFAVLYVVPFLFTNSGPRFRTPLDLMCGTHAVSMLWRLRT